MLFSVLCLKKPKKKHGIMVLKLDITLFDLLYYLHSTIYVFFSVMYFEKFSGIITIKKKTVVITHFVFFRPFHLKPNISSPRKKVKKQS